MIARKGLDHLLAAFAAVAARHSHVRLLLVGREAELPQMLKALPPEVRARVEYAGFQPPEALPRYFAQADVFVLPSRYDGWGVVVNQAIGAGLPVVCSDAVGAAYDLVEDERKRAPFPAGRYPGAHAAASSALRRIPRLRRPGARPRWPSQTNGRRIAARRSGWKRSPKSCRHEDSFCQQQLGLARRRRGFPGVPRWRAGRARA